MLDIRWTDRIRLIEKSIMCSLYFYSYLISRLTLTACVSHQLFSLVSKCQPPQNRYCLWKLMETCSSPESTGIWPSAPNVLNSFTHQS